MSYSASHHSNITTGNNEGDLGSMPLLLERLREIGRSDSAANETSARALRQDESDRGWSDQLANATLDLGLNASTTFLSVREVSRTLRANNPAVTFRKTPQNRDGWVLVLDHRWGKVFRGCIDGGHDQWVDIDTLASDLGIEPDTRIPWVLLDPCLPTATIKKAKPKTSPVRRLIDLVGADRGDLAAVVLFAILVGGLTLATPVAVQQLVNSVALGGLMQPVVVLALLLLGSLGFSAALSAIQAYVVEIVQRRVFVRVAGEVARRLPRVQLEAFDREHGPELVNRFFDVVTVQKVGATLLLDGIALLLQTVIGLLVLSFYHPLMMAFGGVLMLGIGFVAVVFGRGAVATAIAESKAKYAVAGWLEELARHAHDLKTSGASRFANERANDLARRYLTTRATHYRIVFRQLAGALGLQVLASSALLGLGGGLVIAGQLTLGQLVASELIVSAIVASFAKLGKHLESYYDLLAAVDKLGELFDLPLERSDGSSIAPVGDSTTLEVRDVSFTYDTTPVIDGFTMTVEPGERVALRGPSGSGKTTILDLILGFRSPNAGYILLDGVDLREMRLDNVRERIARVSGPEILEGTIEENVWMGRGYVTRKAVRQALERVGVLDRILRLPDGLQAAVSTDGRPLSKGEAIRVAVARAIVGRPQIILIDGSITADLDTKSTQQTLDALFADDAPWGLVVASAHDEDCARCDRIITLDGTPDTRSRTEEPEQK